MQVTTEMSNLSACLDMPHTMYSELTDATHWQRVLVLGQVTSDGIYNLIPGMPLTTIGIDAVCRSNRNGMCVKLKFIGAHVRQGPCTK